MNKLQEIQEYKNHPGISQSKLKRVLSNSVTKEDEDPLKYLKGNLTDTIITMNQHLEDLYHITDITYPEDKYKKVIDYLNPQGDIGDYDEQILIAFKEINNLNWKDETILSKFKSEGLEYWNEKLICGDKQIVSKEYYSKSMTCAMTLLTSPNTKKFLEIQNRLVEEIFFQYPIYFEFDGIQCKGLADAVIFNYIDKTFRLIDIKTTDMNLWDWKIQARRSRVDLQMAYYMEGLTFNFPDYTALSPVLLIENMNNPGKPVVKELTVSDLFIGKHGCQRIKNTIIYERLTDVMDHEMDYIDGFTDAINKLKQSEELALHDYDVDYYRNQILEGKEPLNLWI